MRSTSQNSGICTESLDSAGNKNTYYGFIEDIIELDYGRNLQVPVFKCKWARVPNGVEVDNYGFTIVDLNVAGYKNDPWILAVRISTGGSQLGAGTAGALLPTLAYRRFQKRR